MDSSVTGKLDTRSAYTEANLTSNKYWLALGFPHTNATFRDIVTSHRKQSEVHYPGKYTLGTRNFPSNSSVPRVEERARKMC